MENGTNDSDTSSSISSERPDHQDAPPHPEKSDGDTVAKHAAREATRRYVERVDRYLARPDVIRAGRNAAPSLPS